MVADAGSGALLLHAPLFYEAGPRALHCPMVTANVGGIRTKLIVDTGATEHVLTLDAADRAGLARVAGPPGTDASGSTVESWIVDDVPIEVGGEGLPRGEVAAIAGPDPFAEWGIGGFLSPQRLWPTGTVVVDFAASALSVFEGPGRMQATVADVVRRHPDFTLVDAARHASGTIGVEVEVPPHDPVVAIFDSGASQTEAAFPGGGAEVLRSRSVGGTALEGRAVRSQTLVAGRARIRLEVLSAVDRVPTPDGSADDEVPGALIGMDVLRGTVLVIGPADAKQVVWLVPAQHAAQSG